MHSFLEYLLLFMLLDYMNLYLVLHPRHTVYDIDFNGGGLALVHPIAEHTLHDCRVIHVLF